MSFNSPCGSKNITWLRAGISLCAVSPHCGPSTSRFLSFPHPLTPTHSTGICCLQSKWREIFMKWNFVMSLVKKESGIRLCWLEFPPCSFHQSHRETCNLSQIHKDRMSKIYVYVFNWQKGWQFLHIQSFLCNCIGYDWEVRTSKKIFGVKKK